MNRICELEATFCAGIVSIIQSHGSQCPYSDDCQCRQSAWCHYLQKQTASKTQRYRMLEAGGCHYCDKPCFCKVLNAVEELAVEYLRKGGIHRPPVPSDLIALFDPNRTIELRYVPLKAYHGGSWRLGNEWVIQINSRETHRMKRYTLFHEAFHIASRTVCPAFRREDRSYSPFNELLADYFASCILMPKEWVRERWLKVRNVRKMARLFDVPTSVMRPRLRRLGLLEEKSGPH